jgi:hypothetical protein
MFQWRPYWLPSLRIPNLRCAIICSCHEELPIGGKLSNPDRSGALEQSRQRLTAVGVPDPGAIIAGSNYPLAIGTELGGKGAGGMSQRGD